ncbi:MAG: transporter ATP-binding protein [Marmoricola sp.]|nr:transporter ATP-binding protein [Marmoricola sp.]
MSDQAQLARSRDRALVIDDVDLVYDNGFKALSKASLEVGTDERHALLGPNGAGKTTLFRSICGEIKVTGGSIEVLGEPATGVLPAQLVRRGVGRSFQIGRVFETFTTGENLELAHEASETWPGGTRARRLRPSDEAKSVAHQVAVDFGLANGYDRPASALSHGEKKILELAMAVIQQPRLLLLDEPMAGMSREETERAIEVLRVVGTGRAVLFTEHNMDAVFALADRVTVLARGSVIASGTPDEIRNDPNVREAYLGKRSGAGDFGHA